MSTLDYSRRDLADSTEATTETSTREFRTGAGLELELGQSIEGQPLLARSYGDGAVSVLLLGAIHGNEPGSHLFVRDLEEWFAREPSVLAGVTVHVASPVNPDGLAKGTRRNARGIDLNRNFPATTFRPSRVRGERPLSEPESRFVHGLIERFAPVLVITVHQPRRSINWDGPARALALGMAEKSGYRPEASVGYSTPGSLGSWFGLDLKKPIITLELPRRPAAGKSFFDEASTAVAFALRKVAGSAVPKGL